MIIIRCKKENVQFNNPTTFLNLFKKYYKVSNVSYDEKNRGIVEIKIVNDKVKHILHKWNEIADTMEWFDEAEIVTDKNGDEKVMTWLNVD